MQVRYPILILLGILAVSALLAGCTVPQGNVTTTATPTATTVGTVTMTATPTTTVRPSGPTVFDAIESDEQFTTLNRVIREADTSFLRDTLSGNQSFTFFAPTDDAFDKISNETLDTILNQPEGELTQLVRYHIISGSYPADMLPQIANTTVFGLTGEELSFASTDSTLTVNDATINTSGAISTSNGYVYPIDTVLMRPNVTYTPTPTTLATTQTTTATVTATTTP